MKPTEHQIQQQIINFLRYKGYYVMRLNSGKYSVGEGRSRRFIMGQEAGTPDLMAFKQAPHEGGMITLDTSYHRAKYRFEEIDLLFIEVKRPKMKPTPLQIAKMKELELFGARCIVVHSVEELESALN